MNSEPLSLSTSAQQNGQAAAHLVHGGRDAVVAFAPERLQLDPAGRDVHRTEREQIEALRTAAAVGDEIDLAKAGAGIVPVGEGANGDLLFEPRAGLRGGGAAPRRAGARRREQAGEGRAAGLPDEFLDVWGNGELAPVEESIKQLGHKGVEAMGADAAAGVPEDLDGGGDFRPVPPRPARAGRRGRHPRRAQQQPNGRP